MRNKSSFGFFVFIFVLGLTVSLIGLNKEVENKLVIQTDETLDFSIEIRQVGLEKDVLLYSSEVIEVYKGILNSRFEGGESHILLTINQQEQELVSYLDVNNSLLQITLNLISVNQDEIKLETKVRTSFGTEKGTLHFLK